MYLLTAKSGDIFRVLVFFLISSGSPHVRPMGRTRGGPDEIGLTPMGVELNGSGRVRDAGRHDDVVQPRHEPALQVWQVFKAEVVQHVDTAWR